MEVISLNERERSTTILNTTPPSDNADGLDDLALDNGENVTPFDNDNDDFTIADDSIATDPEAAAANTGVWTKKNKLLASIIAGTALLCAVAAGGGVAAHNARVAARANYCPAPVAPPPVDGKAAKAGSNGGAKASKAGSPPECVECPTDDCPPCPQVSAINLAPEEGGGVRRGLVANNHRNEQEVVTPIGGEGAYYHIPKVVEDKRKNRMLAEHLGHRAVVTSSFSWGDYLNGVKFGFNGGQRRLGLEDVVSEVEEIGGGEEEVTVGETAQDPSVVAANGGGSKGSKSSSSSGSGTAKSSKAFISPALGEGIQCKCGPGVASKAGGPAGTAKSAKAVSAVEPSGNGDESSKSAKSGPSPSTKAGKGNRLAPAYSPNVCESIGGPTPSSKSVGNIVQEPKISTKSVKEPPAPAQPVVPSPPVSPPATATKPPMEPVVKPPSPPTDPSPSPPTPSVNPPTPATEPNPPTPPTEPTDPSPTPPTEPSPSPPTPGSGGGEPNCENDEDWISTNKSHRFSENISTA